MPLIDVSNLSVALQTHRGPAWAVRNISFQIERGQALGLIGESGCGKSITAMALMGLLPQSAQISGSAWLDGQSLIAQPDRWWRNVRGKRIGMVFQEPMTALNPVQTIGQQVAEPLRLHQGLSERQALAQATAMLERVGIAQPAQRLHAYPHQFSGGQLQRITIAMALACGPDLLIADEPTSALDVTVQQQILALINELVAERHMALLLISHDLGVISQNVDSMAVMYGGTIVESGSTTSVFAHMAHPYTRGLLAARPSMQPRIQGQPQRLLTIAGTVPELVDMPAGCTFAGRCSFTQPACFEQIPPAVHLKTCLPWNFQNENTPQQEQFLPDAQPHSHAMAQEDAHPCTAATPLQQTISQPDRLVAGTDSHQVYCLRPQAYGPASATPGLATGADT